MSSAPGSPGWPRHFRLAAAGRQVVLYESGPAAGGRCRSYFDRGLGLRIDNGNHLLLSGNARGDGLSGPGRRAAHAGRPRRGAVSRSSIWPAANAGTWRRDAGRMPWWVLRGRTRVPGTRLRDYLRLLALRRAARGDATVAAVLGNGALYRRLLEPLAIAALNTRPDQGLARLLARVVAETLMRGGAACIPSFPRIGLSESFVDPALAWLRARGTVLHLGRRVSALRIEAGRVAALETTEGPVALPPGDAAVVAAPPWVAGGLLPGLQTPDQFESILNIHFVADAPGGPGGFVGLVGGTAEWVFVKPGIISVTISAANHLVDLSAEAIAARVWPDVRAATGLADPMPPVRVVKERRATFAATAEQDRRRPGDAHRACQPDAGGRLDGHRPAGHDRGRHPIGPRRGRGPAGRVKDAVDAADGRRHDRTCRPRRAGRRRRRAPATPCCAASAPTGIGCSSWRRTPPFPPNTCCWNISSTVSTRSWSDGSASICAASRASMAAGRCSTTARSTSRRASRRISR